MASSLSSGVGHLFENFQSIWLKIAQHLVMNFEFVFVHGVRACSNFIDLYAAVQFSKHYLLQTIFPPSYIIASFVED